jgi:xanthine dehydrogenase accessory factor
MTTILFRGAGDLISGSIRRTHLAGFDVCCTEIAKPLCVRRPVCFSEAVYEGSITIEGVTAVLSTAAGIDAHWQRRVIPIVVDPEMTILDSRRFDVLVDGTMAKRNLGTRIDHARRVIAIGPGFTAGLDCHAVVETLAGHDLGRVITSGSAAADTQVPGPPEAYLCSPGYVPDDLSGTQPTPWHGILLRAPRDGVFVSAVAIGDIVEKNQTVGHVDGAEVRALVAGVVRGLIRDGREVTTGLKIGDVDPTAQRHRAFTISEKSNAIAGGVLEAVLASSTFTRADHAPCE